MKFYLVSGEKSGDLHGANLAHQILKQNKDSKLRGFGGDKMNLEGVEIVKHINQLSFMGFTEVIKNLSVIKKNLDFCKDDIISFNPDAIILIDFPGFNLKIAKFAKEKGIKVVASMSNVAASGGYWISANADEIWASHNTITGSIGIFGMAPSVEKSLDHVGIHTDGVSTGKLDADFDPTKSLDPMLANIIQAEIEYGYDQFISLVSESRGIDKKQVDKIAQGRVWAGKTALELGLVDKLGNLKNAIDRAAELAGIDNFRTYYPAEELDWKQKLLSSIFSISGGIIPESIKENFLVKKSLKALSEMESFNDPKGIYVRCEDC